MESINRINNSEIAKLNNAIAISDLNKNIIYINPSFLKLWGYDNDKDLIGRSIEAFCEIENYSDIIDKLKSGIGLLGNFTAKKKNGTVLNVQTSISIVNDKEGKPVCIVFSFINLDKKQKKEDIEVNKQIQQEILLDLDNKGVGVYIVGYDYRIKFQNSILQKKFGNCIGEYCYKKYMRFEKPCKFCTIKRAIAGNNVEKIEIHGGYGREYELISAPLPDSESNIDNIVVVVRDITEYKKAAEALKESKVHYQNFFENALIGIFRSRLSDGLIIELNSRAAELLNMSSEEIIGKIYASDLYKDPVQREKLINKLKKDGEIHGYEIDMILNDGIERTFSISVKLYPKEDIMEGTIVDITDRKRSEKEKEMLEEQLRQSQKMEAIGTLAGGIAHDFNNILGVIMGYTELTLDGPIDEQSIKKNLNCIMKASERAKDMVQQILDFSRKSNQTMKFVDVGKIVKESIGFLRSSIPKTIDIRHYIENDLEMIFGNSTQINQILMNLCTNAAYAMKKNGGVLEIDLKKVVLDIESSINLDLQPGPYLQLSVSDTGCGMSKEVSERIFEPYFTTKKKGEGTGMGLAVIYGIVSRHNGKINVSSLPQKGTIFKIYFPILETNNIDNIQDNKNSVVKGNNEYILFIDDEIALTELGTQIIKALGYRVESRTSSIEALEAFKSNPDKFDLIITDMTMPNMTGTKLASEVHKIRSDIPIILCSGFSDSIDQNNYIYHGVDAFIKKPVIKKELSKTIRRVLQKKYKIP